MAQFGGEIKVLWKEAGYALLIIPKIAVGALTSFRCRVVLFCLGTSLAVLWCFVEKFRTNATCALFSVKERTGWRTVYAFFVYWVIDHFIFAENTLLFCEIKVFWYETWNAVVIIPKSSRRTLTNCIDQQLPSFTTFTLLGSWIPERIFRTNSTSASIKERIFLRTLNAYLELDVVNLILRTLLTGFISKVKVLWMEAFDALQSIVEMQWVLAFALFALGIVSSTIVAVLAFEACIVIALVWPALNTPLTVEKWFFCGTENTCFWLKAVDFGSWARKALLFFQVKVFRKETLYTVGASVKRSCFWTTTNFALFYIVSSSWTWLAGFDSYVEILVVWTLRTCLSIETRSLGWTSLASLWGRNVYKVLFATFAGLQLIIKMLRQIAGDTLFLSFKGFIFRTLTSIALVTKLLPFLATYALL